MENYCECTNCFNPAIAFKLCSTHYKRLQRHGSTSQTRPKDWGERKSHPLYNSWSWMKRMSGRHSIEPSWKDFWAYVEDIGERPSPRHRLKKINSDLGYTKGNVVWSETIECKDKASYQREWRKQNPDKVKNNELLKTFGISLEQYNNLLQEQNNKCKICGISDDQIPQNLVVDHCHTTGKIRGLLCHHCNTALGLFKESENIMKNAIKYLDSPA